MAKPILDWWVGHSAQDEHARGKPSFTHTTIPYHTTIASLPLLTPATTALQAFLHSSQDAVLTEQCSVTFPQNPLRMFCCITRIPQASCFYISHLVSFSLVRGVCVRATSSCLFCVISLRWNYLKPPFPTTLHLVALFCDFGWQTVFSLSRFIFKM